MASGVIRLEQKNATLTDLGLYDDGPFEVKYSTPEGLDEVAVPANSYLGASGVRHIIFIMKPHFL